MNPLATLRFTAADSFNLEPRLRAWAASVQDCVASSPTIEAYGRIERVSATLIVAHLPGCRIGHL